jgi:hypothetical protein
MRAESIVNQASSLLSTAIRRLISRPSVAVVMDYPKIANAFFFDSSSTFSDRPQSIGQDGPTLAIFNGNTAKAVKSAA